MGYRITYGEQTRKRLPVRHVALGCLAVLAVLALILPSGREVIRDILLPGDPAVTLDALHGMAEDLSQGISIGEAVTTFCGEIIAGGT